VRGAGGVGGAFDETGQGGAVILGTGLADALTKAAGSAGGGVGSDAAWDAVRVASRVAKFGVDFNDGNYPQEAALETKSVSFQKGCYLGQEVVCMLEMRGHVKKKLVLLSIDGDAVPDAHAVVSDASGAPVGEVTSATRLPGKPSTGLAMVKYAVIAPGTELRVGSQRAVVV
jgi:tRNA-modifying protein YgfZ